jgi:hypothetical protein
MAATQNITVVVRVRPLTKKEAGRGAFACLTVPNDGQIDCTDPDDKQLESLGGAKVTDYLRLDKTKDRSYYFDHAISPDISQLDTHDKTTATLVPDVLSGKNACCFAYGATGSGKTFTMTGSEDQPGLIPLAVDALFASAGDEADIMMQYVEIYNEQIKDLLQPENGALDVREAPGRGTYVAGAANVAVTSRDDVEALLEAGNAYRTTESTQLNMVSSRSHAVLQLRCATAGQLNGKLSLIDLAGSERASKTGVMSSSSSIGRGGTQNNSKRLNEGANINRSLLALANCISALAEQARKGSTSATHIPYRDSKLTRLLKDSLGGACRTMMIANVSPASDQFDETLNTLKYADRAKHIRTKKERSPVRGQRTQPRRFAAGSGAAAARSAAVRNAAEREKLSQGEGARAANNRHMARMTAGRDRFQQQQVKGSVWNRQEQQQQQNEATAATAGLRQRARRGAGGVTGGRERPPPPPPLDGMDHTRAALTVQRHARGRLSRAQTQKFIASDILAKHGGAAGARGRQAIEKRRALAEAAGDVPAAQQHRPLQPRQQPSQPHGDAQRQQQQQRQTQQQRQQQQRQQQQRQHGNSAAAGGGLTAVRSARSSGGGGSVAPPPPPERPAESPMAGAGRAEGSPAATASFSSSHGASLSLPSLGTVAEQG